MTKTKLEIATVLAFERKLDPSDALFYSGIWGDQEKAQAWRPVAIQEKSVRGTVSNRLKNEDQDPAKLDADIQNPNLQTVDVATLPPEADTLRVRFSLRVLPRAGTPSACNNIHYRRALEEAVGEYVKSQGFTELSHRYAHNLANGRFLWRNLLCAEEVEVLVRHVHRGEAKDEWRFDALDFSLRHFDAPKAHADKIKALAEVIRQGLTGDEPVFLEVAAFARMGMGQEVFPSQELIMNQDNSKKVEKSKTLYQIQGTAAFHSQKIGNALRTIDTWYPDAEELNLGPIAVEPYGAVTSMGTAFRPPKQKMDFYNLLDRWVLKGEPPEVEQQHFVIANLVRGGVFG